MEIENVFTVTDINEDQLTKECLEYIESTQPTYKDQVLREHIYDISRIQEDISHGQLPEPTEAILAELEEIESVCADCSYFRIITN